MTDIELNDELELLTRVYEQMREKMGRFIVGNERLTELCMLSLLSEGHLLIEGTPGTGKTSMVKAMAKISGCGFSRFQCAVDYVIL